MPAALQITSDFKGDHLSVHMASVTGDVKCVYDAAITIGTVILTSATATFVTSDLGKLVKVYGAGAGGVSPHLYTTIAAVINSTTVHLAAAAARTVAAAQLYWGRDQTSRVQAILNVANALYLPHGGYALKGPITVKPGVRIYGENKGAGFGVIDINSGAPLTAPNSLPGATLFNFSDSDYLFVCDTTGTPLESEDGFTFEHFAIVGKRGVRLNAEAQTVPDVTALTYILPVKFSFMMFWGDYTITGWNTGAPVSEDPEAFTSTLPTSFSGGNPLANYGIGISLTKVLRAEINQCHFVNYGIGVYLGASSQCGIRNHNRFFTSGVWIWHFTVGVEGNYNKIFQNELLWHSRVGGIYNQFADGGLQIDQNWFEQIQQNHPSSTYIWSDSDFNLQIKGNQFLDNYSRTAPFYRIAPRSQAIIAHNGAILSGLTRAYAIASPVNWENSGTWATMAKAFGNATDFPLPSAANPFPQYAVTSAPAVINTPDNELYRFAYDSPANIAGAVTASFPWIQSPVTGRWVINTAVLGFIWFPPIQSPAHRDFRLSVTARKLAGPDFFLTAYYFQYRAAITAVTATAPIQITTAAPHGLLTGDTVFIKDALLASGASSGIGLWPVTVTSPTQFTLNGSNGIGNAAYTYGGLVYFRSQLATFDTTLSKTTDAETIYLFFGLPDADVANGFLGIDTTNDRAEIEALKLTPLSDMGIVQGRDAQTAPLLQLRTFDGITRDYFETSGRAGLTSVLSSFKFKTASYAVLTTDKYIAVDTSGGAVVITLPPAANAFDVANNLSQSFVIKWVSGSNPLIVATSGGQTIDGSATYTFENLNDSAIFLSSSVSWNVISERILQYFFKVAAGQIETNNQVGIGMAPGVSIFLDVAGITQSVIFRLNGNGAVASAPVRSDSSKDLTTGPIDLSNADVTGILAHTHLDGATLTLGEATGVTTTLLTYVTSVDFVLMTYTTNSTTVAVGLTIFSHTVNKGLVMT